MQLARWLPRAWSCLLALLLLGPALGGGFVLTYDMVWVPDLGLRPDMWGTGSGLPRAVPSDVVVALLDEVVPGAVLQKVVLLGALVAGGWGIAELAPDAVAARLVAVSVYQWNPFVAERLFMGHWPVLVGYAVLPWIVLGVRRWRETGAVPMTLLLLVPLGSLSASAGLATAVTLVAFGWARSRALPTTALVLAANAPWVAAGLLHAPVATTDAAGAELFALNGTDSVPAPLAALGLGGIWNSEVVLPSTDGALGWVWLALLVGLSGLGLRAWWQATARRDTTAYLVCWGIGYGLALLTWAAPAAMGLLVGHVPGAGLVRDGARALALCAPLVAVLAASGADLAARRVPAAGGLRVTLAAGLVLLPVTVMPDALFGLSGRLDPAHYPPAYEAARAAVADRTGPGDVVSLPLGSYRQPSWNHDRKVLDPVGRYLDRDYVASDVLVVSGTRIGGEDPRMRQVAEDLDAATPEERARLLADGGIGVVVVDRAAPGAKPEVTGEVLVESDDLAVLVLEAPRQEATPASWVVVMAAAWAAFAGPLVLAPVGSWLRRRRRRGNTAEESPE